MGNCLSVSGNEVTGVVNCTATHGAKVTATADSKEGCPLGTTTYLVESNQDLNPGRVICLDVGS